MVAKTDSGFATLIVSRSETVTMFNFSTREICNQVFVVIKGLHHILLTRPRCKRFQMVFRFRNVATTLQMSCVCNFMFQIGYLYK